VAGSGRQRGQRGGARRHSPGRCRCRCRARRGRARFGGHLGGLTEVGPDDFGVGLHLGRGAVGDEPAKVQHGHPVGDPHHQAHVVLDQDNGDAQGGPNFDDQYGHPPGLVGIHAGDGLVQQEKAGFGAQCPGNLDPLLVAVGQHPDRDVELVRQVEELGNLPRPRPVSPVLAARLGQLQPTGEEAGLGQVVSAEHQVLLDRLHCGQGDVLECPGHPQPGDLVRPQPGELLVTELHTAFGRPVNPGQDVETGRLPGAVGTDDGVNGPGGDGEAHPVQRLDAGEAHSDVAYRQLGYVDAIARLPLGRHPAHRVRCLAATPDCAMSCTRSSSPAPVPR